MNNLLHRLISAMRHRLKLSAIEQGVADIKNDVANIRQTLVDIRKTMEEGELRTSAGLALLSNQQHQHLEITICELKRVIHEVSTLTAETRWRGDEEDRK